MKKKRKFSFKAACRKPTKCERKRLEFHFSPISFEHPKKKLWARLKLKFLQRLPLSAVPCPKWQIGECHFMYFITTTDNIHLCGSFYNLVLNRVLIIFIKRVGPLQSGGKKSAQQIAEIGQDGAMKYSEGTVCQTQSSLTRKEGSWPQGRAAVWRQWFLFSTSNRNHCSQEGMWHASEKHFTLKWA